MSDLPEVGSVWRNGGEFHRVSDVTGQIVWFESFGRWSLMCKSSVDWLAWSRDAVQVWPLQREQQQPGEPKPETVRVRGIVGIDAGGGVYAYGTNRGALSDEQLKAIASCAAYNPVAFFDVDVPNNTISSSDRHRDAG